jgi:hypothetical protein
VLKAFARTISVAVLAVGFCLGTASIASATSVPVGFIIWDVNFPGNAGEFDIVNETGVNSSGDSTFPVTTTLAISPSSLHVDFSNGSSSTFGPGYFSLAADGQSLNGSPIPIGGANPLPTGAQLVATGSPLTVTLFDGSTVSILSALTIGPITPSSGRTLSDGDFAIIFAETGTSTGPAVPEPATLTLVGLGAAGIIRRKLASRK